LLKNLCFRLIESIILSVKNSNFFNIWFILSAAFTELGATTETGAETRAT
jgi:hypothetical protein